MRVPLYPCIVSDGIPLPNNQFLLDIPVESQDLFTPETDIDGIHRIVLVFTTTDDEPFSLLKDVSKLAAYSHEVGVLCQVDELTETDQFLLANLWIEKRVYIRTLISGSDFEDPDRILAEIDIVEEDFLPSEESMIPDLETLAELIIENPQAFSDDISNRLQRTKEPLQQLDMAADFVLKTPEDRLKYLISEDNWTRLNMVVRRLKDYTNKPKTPSKPKRRTLLSKKPYRIHTAESIKEQFIKTPLPENVRHQVSREIEKLDLLTKGSNEYSTVMDYLTWVFDVPWGVTSRRDYDLSQLIKQLDKTHHGLHDVKKHILEHLTIESLKGGTSGTVLCFIGPPGTGKTSIAKEIARVCSRQLVQIALGGLSYESEIRGHRRTYLGSRPGRFVVGLRNARAMDPLFVLDEIDKLNSRHGDPASALLEILDYEQNDHFVDRYLEFPLNLSQAMFICTANNEKSIPVALKDRMETVYFHEYTKEERSVILSEYMLPKVVADYNLGDLEITVTPEAIDILSKTEQVRQMEKKLRKLLRGAAVDIVVYEHEAVIINSDFINKNKSRRKVVVTRMGFGRDN